MEGREFKDVMYDGLAKMLKALSNPFRLEIIEMFSQGEKSVEGIVQTTRHITGAVSVPMNELLCV